VIDEAERSARQESAAASARDGDALAAGRLALVAAKKNDAKNAMDVSDYASAIEMYEKALEILAEARMVALGLASDDWEATRCAAEAACGEGEPWCFRVIWGAMAQRGEVRDEDAAKLFSNLSLCHGRCNEWARAQGDASAALNLWPEWTKAIYRLSEAYSHLGNHGAALTQARRARLGAGKDQADIRTLHARVLSRSLQASNLRLHDLEGLNPENSTQLQIEQYQALALLERDVFRASSGWREGMEAIEFPHLYPSADDVWDTHRPQPVRFADYIKHFLTTDPKFQADARWQSWANDYATNIRAGLDKLVTTA